MTAAIDLGIYKEFVDQFPGLIAVMDTHCRFLLSNEQSAAAYGFPSEEATRGITAHDLRCPAVESAEDYIHQHHYVMENDINLTMLDISQFADGGQRIYITQKYPLKLDGEVAGIICQCTEIETDPVKQLAKTLMDSDTSFHSQDVIGRSYTVGASLDEQDLTREELDCLFYLIRGCNDQKTACYLGMSEARIRECLCSIKAKWGCSNEAMLIEHAISHGLVKYVPRAILSHGLSYVLSDSMG